MRHLFLFGDLRDNLPDLVGPFVAAAGGAAADIVLLLMGGELSRQYLPRYRDPLLAAGAAAVTPILPGADGSLPPAALAQMRAATGILMGGGTPARYRDLYATGELGALIRERYRQGVPYAGVSAGALLAAGTCALAGNRVEAPGNRYWVRPLYEAEPQPLILGAGLGLLPGGVVDVHLAEWGALPRLLAVLERTGARFGIGVDEPACVYLQDEAALTVSGQGRVYLVHPAAGTRRFHLQALEPGEGAAL